MEEISFLHLGDTVSLYTEGRVNGFIKTLSLLDSRCIIQPNAGDLKQPPNDFLDCLFKIVPENRYSAQRQYRRQLKKNVTAVTFDKNIVKKLEVLFSFLIFICIISLFKNHLILLISMLPNLNKNKIKQKAKSL
jgi:hypothetical protein